MNVELLKIYLDEWKFRSRKYSGGPKGYPRRSVGFISGGFASTLDDWEDDLDRQIISALDTIIYVDLPENQKVAILIVTDQMPNVFKSNRQTLEDSLEMAFRSVWQGLVDRKLV